MMTCVCKTHILFYSFLINVLEYYHYNSRRGAFLFKFAVLVHGQLAFMKPYGEAEHHGQELFVNKAVHLLANRSL